MDSLEKYPPNFMFGSLLAVFLVVFLYLSQTIQPPMTSGIRIPIKQTLQIRLKTAPKEPSVHPQKTESSKIKQTKKQKEQTIQEPTIDPILSNHQPENRVVLKKKEIPEPIKTMEKPTPVEKTIPEKETPVIKKQTPPLDIAKPIEIKEKSVETAQSKTVPGEKEASTVKQSGQTTEPQPNWRQLVMSFFRQVDQDDYYPRTAKRRYQQGTVVLLLTLQGQGKLKLTGIEIAKSSRYSHLDQAAKTMIQDNQADLEDFLKPYMISLAKPVQFPINIRFNLK